MAQQKSTIELTSKNEKADQSGRKQDKKKSKV